MIKTLCLVRHAKATQQMTELADIDRPLIERGYKDAHAISKKPQVMAVKPQLLISSPGIRALTTALIFARNLNYPAAKIILVEKMYNASLENILQVVAEIPDPVNRVMLFGHNPSITNTANLLSSEMVEHIPTCGISCIDFDVNNWYEIGPRSGKIRFFDHPKNL